MWVIIAFCIENNIGFRLDFNEWLIVEVFE
jgi:hypothetical protein